MIGDERVRFCGECRKHVYNISAMTKREAETLLRESEGRYRSLFESAPDGILVTDSKGTYVDVNPSGLRMLGYSRDELIGWFDLAGLTSSPGRFDYNS